MHNQTPTALAMRLVATLADEDLDDCIAIEIRADGRRLVRAPLGEMRRVPPRAEIEAGRRTRLRLAVWVPEAAPSGYQGAA